MTEFTTQSFCIRLISSHCSTVITKHMYEATQSISINPVKVFPSALGFPTMAIIIIIILFESGNMAHTQTHRQTDRISKKYNKTQ